jgi:hypothetical protein
MSKFAYYIGVDHREPDALRVTEASVRAYASKPVEVKRLEHIDLRRRQLVDRPWRINEDGTYTDERDGKPFSVQFSHTRFLTPIVAKLDGVTDWALFTDCDWLWLNDIHKILQEADSSKTVMVVPHRFEPDKTVKMDGQIQSRYKRKMWSALMLWNLKSNKLPTIEMVNEASGNHLHTFGWLQDNDIGYLSERWHWIPNYSPTTEAAQAAEEQNRPIPVDAVHFTFGPPVPGMTNREPTPFDNFWTNELTDAYSHAR